MQVKCDVCYGAKKVTGIGFIYTDCVKCKGTGLIEAVKKPTSPPPSEPAASGINEPLVLDEVHDAKKKQGKKPHHKEV